MFHVLCSMIKFDIITIFPEIFDSYFKESIIKRATDKGLIKINIHDLRGWTSNHHQTVDDRPFGGGIGMVVKVEPIYKAIQSLKLKGLSRAKPKGKKRVSGKGKRSKVVLFSPRGKKFNQKIAFEFSKLDQLIMICGRYEGIDERVAKHIADIKLSVGNYVLMGGELPAMLVVETVARLIPGVLGKQQLLKERITKEKGFIEYPQYTRPEIFEPKKGEKWRVPKVLLSGNHKKIAKWRRKHQKIIEK